MILPVKCCLGRVRYVKLISPLRFTGWCECDRRSTYVVLVRNIVRLPLLHCWLFLIKHSCLESAQFTQFTFEQLGNFRLAQLWSWAIYSHLKADFHSNHEFLAPSNLLQICCKCKVGAWLEILLTFCQFCNLRWIRSRFESFSVNFINCSVLSSHVLY